MGIGLTEAQTPEGAAKGMVLSPYIHIDRVDPRMLPKHVS
jgi:hypothetical protein